MRRTRLNRQLTRLLAVGLELAMMATPTPAQVIIRPPVIIDGDRYDDTTERQVLVEFVAQGNEWAEVFLNGRRMLGLRNFNRRQSLFLEPGAYYLEITGADRFEKWASGYLDIGLNDSNVLVVTFSRENGVWVSGNPDAWIPDVD
jgi:hypothetical protein